MQCGAVTQATSKAQKSVLFGADGNLNRVRIPASVCQRHLFSRHVYLVYVWVLPCVGHVITPSTIARVNLKTLEIADHTAKPRTANLILKHE